VGGLLPSIKKRAGRPQKKGNVISSVLLGEGGNKNGTKGGFLVTPRRRKGGSGRQKPGGGEKRGLLKPKGTKKSGILFI